MNQPTAEIDPLLRLPDVLALVPVSRATWLRGVRDGRCPRPVRLGPNCVAWRASAVRAWIESLQPTG